MQPCELGAQPSGAAVPETLLCHLYYGLGQKAMPLAFFSFLQQ